MQGDGATAIAHSTEALELFTAAGDRHGQAETLHSLGLIKADVAGPQEAVGPLRQSLELAEAIGSPGDTARALAGLAQCELRLGERERALEDLERAAGLFDRVGAAEAQETEALLASLRGGER